MSQRNKKSPATSNIVRATAGTSALAKFHSTYGDHHRMFLQAFLSRGIFNGTEVKKLFRDCSSRFNETTDLTQLPNFVRAINDQIKSLQMEIKKGISEANGVHFYALANTAESPITRMTNFYSQNELELFKKVVERIVESEVGTLSSVGYLNLADILEKKLSKKEAQELLVKLIDEKWLEEIDGRISLSTRTLIELDQYIRDKYPKIITLCNMCHQLVVQGQACNQCDVKMHKHCAQRCYQNRDNPKCPECKTPWSHNIESSSPQLNQSQSEASQSTQNKKTRKSQRRP